MEPILLLPLFVSFYVTLILLPGWVKRAKRFGLFGKDMNKYDKPKVAEAGGVMVVAGFILGILFYIALKTFYFQTNETIVNIFALTTSILILAGIGIIDGLLGWRIGLRKRFRILFVLIAAIPLMVINAGHSTVFLPFIGKVNFGLIYPLILIPVGIIGATTTFNFVAGFNGLEARQGIIILTALSIVSYFTGNSWLALVGMCMVFSLLAFWIFNKYPSKVFPGDVMTYPLGGLIAIMAILGNMERIAVFFFIPYIIETFLKLRGKLIKQSFGKPIKEGFLELKYKKIYSLNHLSIFLLGKIKNKVKETDVIFSINLFQIIIIIIGFIIFRGNIF